MPDLWTIALDFGASFSGYAIATRELKRQGLQRHHTLPLLTIKTTWKASRGGVPYPKTRTSMMYDTCDKRVTKWGNEATYSSMANLNSELTYVDRVKLLLNDDWASSDVGQRLLDHLGMKSAEAISLFLKKLAEEAISSLENNNGAAIARSSIRWVLTVPSMWTYKAKATMRTAMHSAGLIDTIDSDHLLFCLEPEAALLTVAFSTDQILVGATTLVLDAGGGTVDYSAFQMMQPDTTKQSYVFHEIARGRGIVKGSMILDDAFAAHMRAALGDGAWDAIARGTNIPDAWETIKHSYDGDRNHDCDLHELSMPSSIYRKLKGQGFTDVRAKVLAHNRGQLGAVKKDDDTLEDSIFISGATVRGLFDAVLVDILQVTADMLKSCAAKGKPVTTIVCVGGFCLNKHLVTSIRKSVEIQFPGTKVFAMANPGAAVVQGAAIYGTFPELIGARVVRYSYGFKMDLPLSDKRFTGKTIPRWNISKNAGVEYVQGSFSIILKKGEQQSENRTSSIITPKSKDQKALKIELYESDVESPLFVTDAGCRKLGVITLSADARTTTIELLFTFGSTEIRVEAKDTRTGVVRSLSIDQ